MGFDEVIQVITTVGFPIAVTVYLLFQNKYEADKHDKEIDMLNKTLTDMIVTLTKLTERLEKNAD